MKEGMMLPNGTARRGALYLRVSGGVGQTYENQRPDVVQLARARGLEVVHVFEEVASAAKRRPEFEKMMLAAHRGVFDVLVVWAIDRFGRNMVTNLSTILELDRLGVEVVSVREPWLDTRGPVRPPMNAGTRGSLRDSARRRTGGDDGPTVAARLDMLITKPIGCLSLLVMLGVVACSSSAPASSEASSAHSVAGSHAFRTAASAQTLKKLGVSQWHMLVEPGAGAVVVDGAGPNGEVKFSTAYRLDSKTGGIIVQSFRPRGEMLIPQTGGKPTFTGHRLNVSAWSKYTNAFAADRKVSRAVQEYAKSAPPSPAQVAGRAALADMLQQARAGGPGWKISITSQPTALKGGHNAGHVFITVTSPDGRTVTAGYNRTGNALRSQGTVELGQDSPAPNSSTLDREITGEQAAKALEYVQERDANPGNYSILPGVGDDHCGTFALKTFETATGEKLPEVPGVIMGGDTPAGVADRIIQAGGQRKPAADKNESENDPNGNDPNATDPNGPGDDDTSPGDGNDGNDENNGNDDTSDAPLEGSEQDGGDPLPDDNVDNSLDENGLGNEGDETADPAADDTGTDDTGSDDFANDDFAGDDPSSDDPSSNDPSSNDNEEELAVRKNRCRAVSCSATTAVCVCKHY